jgi:hypothetical protein
MNRLLLILLFAYGLAVTTDDIYDNSYALIIGIDKYENVRSLDYAVKDAEDIQSMLIDKFHFQQDNIVLLKNEEATKASIIQEFSNITKKAGNNDRVLIFFAGHGETEDLPDGGEMGYLLPVDGNKTDLYISSIKMDEIQTISLRSEAKHILYLIDACYGGIATVGARGLDAESTPNYLNKITQYKARQIISAGGRGEQVIEKSEWGHSAFTKNLLSGLRDWMADTDSDGIITVQELGTYLKKKVTIDSNNKQTPKTRNLTTDEGEFVFFQDEVRKTINNSLDFPISQIENNIKINSPQTSKTVKLRSFYIGEINNGHGLGVQGGWYLDEGQSEVGLDVSLADAAHSDLDLVHSLGFYYRYYFIPYGTLFINSGMDITGMYIINSPLDGEDHMNMGFNPYIGFGYMVEMFNKSIIANMNIGYLLIPNNNISGISYEELPHGFQVDITFGIHKRNFIKRFVIMPE